MTAFEVIRVRGALNRLQDLSAADRQFIVSLAGIDGKYVLPAGEKQRLGEISLQLQTKIEGLIKKICQQICDSPEEKLMGAILDRAVQDAFFTIGAHQQSAVIWLLGEMFPVSDTDLNPEWVRVQFKKAGVPIEGINVWTDQEVTA